jgi:hypothetical protein
MPDATETAAQPTCHEDGVKVDSLTDVARILYKHGTKLAFDDLDPIKPFISCQTGQCIRRSTRQVIYRF